MAGRTLRAVGADEVAPTRSPKTLEAAVDMDRLALLTRGRLEIAKQIDAGVPAHALGRLIATMNELDIEIRRLDAEDEEAGRGRAESSRRSFDSAAI